MHERGSKSRGKGVLFTSMEKVCGSELNKKEIKLLALRMKKGRRGSLEMRSGGHGWPGHYCIEKGDFYS